MTTTGGALLVGGQSARGAVHRRGEGNNVVIIRIPKQPITLTRVGGTETMTVNNLTLDGPTSATSRPDAVRLPGRRDAERQRQPGRGTYTGTFDVSIQYP